MSYFETDLLNYTGKPTLHKDTVWTLEKSIFNFTVIA